jgi:hypothetical protein
MQTKYGIRGAITPRGPFVRDMWSDDEFELSLVDGVLEVGFEDESQIGTARALVAEYLNAYNANHNTRYEIDMNQSWRPNPESNRAWSVEVSDVVNVSDTLTTTLQTQTGFFSVKTGNSSLLSAQRDLVRKGRQRSALALALKYFAEEVVRSERPGPGIYRVLEELEKVMPGTKRNERRARLGELVGEDLEYVDRVMDAVQPQRHHSRYSLDYTPPLDMQECRERARKILDAYAIKGVAP